MQWIQLILISLVVGGGLQAEEWKSSRKNLVETQAASPLRYNLWVWSNPPANPPRSDSDRFWRDYEKDPSFRQALEMRYVVKWVDARSFLKRKGHNIRCLPAFEGPGFILYGYSTTPQAFLARLGLNADSLPQQNTQPAPVNGCQVEVGELRSVLDKLREDHLRLVKAHNDFIGADGPYQENIQSRLKAVEESFSRLRDQLPAPVDLKPLEARLGQLERSVSALPRNGHPVDLGPLRARVQKLETEAGSFSSLAQELARLDIQLASLQSQVNRVDDPPEVKPGNATIPPGPYPRLPPGKPEEPVVIKPDSGSVHWMQKAAPYAGWIGGPLVGGVLTLLGGYLGRRQSRRSSTAHQGRPPPAESSPLATQHTSGEQSPLMALQAAHDAELESLNASHRQEIETLAANHEATIRQIRSSRKTETRYVRVEGGDAVGEAYKEALRRVAAHNGEPVMGTIRQIESVANQILHGQTVSFSPDVFK